MYESDIIIVTIIILGFLFGRIYVFLRPCYFSPKIFFFVVHVLLSIHTVHDSVKDKEFELELSWVCTESKGRHEFVPKDIAEEAERLAKVKKKKKSFFFSGLSFSSFFFS